GTNKVEPAYKLWKQLVADRDQMANAVQSQVIAPLDSRILAYEARLEAERKRLKAEAQEAARKAQEEAASAEAAHLEAIGDKMGAESVISEAANSVPPPVVIQSMVPKVAGKATKTTWKWRLKDASKIRPEYLQPDETKIGQVVRALKKSAESA